MTKACTRRPGEAASVSLRLARLPPLQAGYGARVAYAPRLRLRQAFERMHILCLPVHLEPSTNVKRRTRSSSSRARACIQNRCGDYKTSLSGAKCVHAQIRLALPRVSHSGEIALAGSRRLRFTLAAAPVLVEHAAVTETKNKSFQPTKQGEGLLQHQQCTSMR